MALTFAVLGPVEVRRDGAVLRVPAGRTTEVLVRLALEAGRPVRADRLLEDLWADASGTGRNTGRNTLQSKVSQLRRALGDPALVAGTATGYTLAVDPSAVDALVVLDLAATATGQLRDGDAAGAVESATEALALFSGEVLAGAGDAGWVTPFRARLEELRLGLLEDRAAARVELGAAGDLVGDLESLVAEHPVRERLWAALITALYRAGRQADALAAYHRARDAFADELGIEPGPALRELQGQVLSQSRELDGTGESRTTLPASPGNLPALVSPLVGRTGDLSAVTFLLRSRRLVTLVGPAGIGKSRLAVDAAHGCRAPGGVWLVRLDAADGETSIAQLVAETLHVTGGEAALSARFAGREEVLVLDGCEHVVDAVADLVAGLLAAAPPLRVLVTSQLALGLDGEAVHPLEPLSMEDATALFIGRALESRRRLVMDAASAVVVEQICRSLDGLPLAIELAAARTRSLSVPEIARRLDDRFALLRDPTSRAPERRRALEAAIGWSYGLLFPDDQRGLWALSAFAGGAPLDAAEEVLGALGVPGESAVDVVGRLVDRSLVSLEGADGGEVRYRLLDSIRDFAQHRLAEAGLGDTAARAHAAWFARAADRSAATVRGAAQPDCLALVRQERSNIDAALAWSSAHDPLVGLRIATGFGWSWVVLGDGVAGARRLHGALLAAERLAQPDQRVQALLLSGWLEASAGDVDRAAADLEEALALASALSDERLVADAWRHLAFARVQQGRPQEVVELTTSSLEVYRALGLGWETAASLVLAAYGSTVLGDLAGAAAAAEEAVQLLTRLGDAWGLLHAEAMLGTIAQAEHRFEDAARSLAAAAAAAGRLGFPGQAALHLTTLGRVDQRRGHHEAAAGSLQRAVAAATEGGDHRMAATARVTLARILRAVGDAASARGLLEENDRWFRTYGGGEWALVTRCLLGALSSDGDALRGVLVEARRDEDREAEVLALDALARIAAETGDTDAAAGLLARADQVFERVAHLLDESDRYDASLVRAGD